MASAGTQQRKKRVGQLDIDDMERRIVEFRLMLDREKRRCQAAKMADKFEQLIRDKLSELNQETGAATNNEGGSGGGGPRSAPANDHMIQLQTLDKEAFGRLSNFLRYTVDKCSRSEQHEQFQTVLRDALLSARRKVTTAAMQNPATATQPLLEPFCYFCAGNFNSTCLNCCQSAATSSVVVSQPTTISSDQPVSSSNAPQTQTQQPDVHMNTPPPTAAPTPEVGEQARADSEQQLRALTNGPATAETWTRGQREENHEGQDAGGEHPSMADLQVHFSQSFTTTSQQQQQKKKQQQQQQKRSQSSNASQDTIVPPSDGDETSSDESDEMDPNGMRSILSELHAPGGVLHVREEEDNQDDAEESQRRSSTPLSDAGEPHGQLVIDEDAANRSQASTHSSGDYGLLTTGRAPSPIASSSPRLARVKTKVTMKKSKGVKDSSSLASGSGVGIKFKSSTSASTATASTSSHAKGNKLEQVSERLRSSNGGNANSSSSSTNKNGDKFARRKFQPKRRNNNDKRK